MMNNFGFPGLGDLCVSRTSFWGIPQILIRSMVCVWLDALTNYITGIVMTAMESHEQFKRLPADLHLIGKILSVSIRFTGRFS